MKRLKSYRAAQTSGLKTKAQVKKVTPVKKTTPVKAVKKVTKVKAVTPVKKVKSASAKSKPAAKIVKKVKASAVPTTKTNIIAHYMTALDWDRKDVIAFLNAQDELMLTAFKRGGTFIFPGIVKISGIFVDPKLKPAIKKGQEVAGFGGTTKIAEESRAAFYTNPRARFKAIGFIKSKEQVIDGRTAPAVKKKAKPEAKVVKKIVKKK
jgi:hypothetical protein